MSRPVAKRFPTGWLGGLGCGALIMVDPASVVFLAILLAPSMLMRIGDGRPEGAGARAVLLWNMAAVIGPVCRLWQEMPPSLARAIDMLSGVTIVAWAWLAAGLGWLLSEGLILAANLWLSARDRQLRERLQAEVDVLMAEWGKPPDTHKAPA